MKRVVTVAVVLGLAAACGGKSGPPPAVATVAKPAPKTLEDRCAAGDGAACADACRTKVGIGSEAGLRALPSDRALQARALCDRGCDLGDSGACGGSGLLRLFGLGGPSDPPAGLALLSKACEGGSAKACGNLGGTYVAGRFGVPPDPARGFALLERACKEGYGYACVNLARTSLDLGDAVKSEAYGKRACDQGEEGGCVVLGILAVRGYRRAEGAADQPESLFKRACDKGESLGCTALADMYYFGHGGPKDERRGCELFVKSCEMGEAEGCRNAGYCWSRGLLGPVDPAKAGEAFARACDGGNLAACVDLGMTYETQDRGLDHVASLYRRACDAKITEACANLGRVYLNGIGVARDLDKAEALFKATCVERSVAACNGLALIEVARSGGWPDKADAIKKAYEARCKANDAAACYTLALLLEDGPRAKDALKKACDAKNVGACLEKERREHAAP
ncbi:MAG TPA: tetratricopeptide repeat protein [Polyangiaceae bacterium]